jgi:nucleoside-diphosphate-sugar epimerase
VASAVDGQDVVAHLGFIIPKLSATGVESESRPDWAREINVGGTQNLIEAVQSQRSSPRLVFTSSFHVYGRTQDQAPPRTVTDPVQAIEHYSRHKIACEEMVRESGVEWSIFRLAAALPLAVLLDSGMFDVPLANRIEFVHTHDVGRAIANAVDHADIWGKTLNIGGGASCQYHYRDMAEQILGRMGVGMLPEAAFSSVPFPTDWLDTAESQRLLRYQRLDLSDYLDGMEALLGGRRLLIRAFRPVVRAWLLSRSPYYGSHRSGDRTRHLATEPG